MDWASRRVTRRDVLRLGGGGAASAVAVSLTGCDLFSTEPDSGDGNDGGGAAKGKEAPELAEQVKAGTLPPLDQRLPKRPLVVKPTERIGVYGGTWYAPMPRPSAGILYSNIGYDNLLRWNLEWTDIVPNFAESVDSAKEGREYTFHLREGTKWSDGQPFTADDIVFAYDDVLRNEEIFPVIPDWLTAGGEPAILEKLDDYTIRFTFREPSGLFLLNIAAAPETHLTAVPKHYFKRFHNSYNSEVEKLAEQEGYSSWAELFLAMGGQGFRSLSWWQNPEIPTLLAWRLTEPLTGNRLVVERNPYYWKTDPDGSQLPYLDMVVHEVIEDQEVMMLRASRGEFSLLRPANVSLNEKPVLASNREAGNYRFIDMQLLSTNDTVFVLNLAPEDPIKREVFQNKEFRIGLSYAIDRQEIIDTVFARQGEPWQTSPLRESGFFDEQLAKQYTEYDVAKAGEHLDTAGYTERDGEGFRLGPDGKRISIGLELRSDTIATWPDVAELVKGYWREVGIEMTVKTGAGELILSRVAANQHDATMDDGYPGSRGVVLNPIWYFPFNSNCQWAVPWGKWYETGGKEGRKPPEAPQRQMNLYDQVMITADEERRQQLFKQILRIAQEEFYVIGTNAPGGGYNIVQNNLHNLPNKIRAGHLAPSPGWTKPEQYYIDS